jgi:hypothetical protein
VRDPDRHGAGAVGAALCDRLRCPVVRSILHARGFDEVIEREKLVPMNDLM